MGWAKSAARERRYDLVGDAAGMSARKGLVVVIPVSVLMMMVVGSSSAAMALSILVVLMPGRFGLLEPSGGHIGGARRTALEADPALRLDLCVVHCL